MGDFYQILGKKLFLRRIDKVGGTEEILAELNRLSMRPTVVEERNRRERARTRLPRLAGLRHGPGPGGT